MIYIGFTTDQKAAAVAQYCRGLDIDRVIAVGPEKFWFDIDGAKWVDWPEIIMYRTFYPLLQEIDRRTLVVVNECLRTQNRHDLTYNCIRHYLAQAGHQIVFQWFPVIDSEQDFMTLFDFDTRSKWKRERFDETLFSECDMDGIDRSPSFIETAIEASDKLRVKYIEKKLALIESIGLKDPNTIPRNLHMVGGAARAAASSGSVIARNKRSKIPDLVTYKEGEYPGAPYTAIDFPHNFIDMADFCALSRQQIIDVIATDLKVDQWYLERFNNWSRRVGDAFSSVLES